MLLQPLSALTILLLPSLVTSFPLDIPFSLSAAAAAASGRNLYLATCTPRKRRGDNDDDDDPKPDPTPAIPFTALIYFKEPLTNSTDGNEKGPRGDQNVVVSNPASAWEGVKWSVKAWRSKVFTSEIATGAQGVGYGGLAGTAKLDSTGYVCFRDGETKLRYKDDDLRGNCAADYWCASLDAGNSGNKDGGGN